MQNELFETAPIHKAYLKLAIPVVMSSVLTLVYNLVDTYFIAKTGNTQLVAGVSLCSPIFTLMIALGDILGLGGASVISRLFGQHKNSDGKRLSIFCFYGSIVIGLCMTLLCLAFQSQILSLLGASSDTAAYASNYFTWIAIGSPFIIFALTPTNLLRTEGFATAAMTGSIIGSIVNMILDPIFIFTFNMGAGGAAIATVIGNIFADIFYVWFLTHRSKNLSLNLKEMKISKEEVKAILMIGIPSSITNIMASIGTTFLNRSLQSYGSEYIAAMGIVSKVTMIVIMIMVGFSFGGQPLFGYQVGSKNYPRLKACLKFAYMLVCGIALAMSIIIFIFAPQILSLFMKDADLLNIGTGMLRIMLLSEVFTGFVMVTTCFFQSAGKAGSALTLSAGRQGYIYIVILTLLSAVLGYTGVIAAQPISDVLTAVIAAYLLKKCFKRLTENNDTSELIQES